MKQIILSLTDDEYYRLKINAEMFGLGDKKNTPEEYLISRIRREKPANTVDELLNRIRSQAHDYHLYVNRMADIFMDRITKHQYNRDDEAARAESVKKIWEVINSIPHEAAKKAVLQKWKESEAFWFRGCELIKMEEEKDG